MDGSYLQILNTPVTYSNGKNEMGLLISMS